MNYFADDIRKKWQFFRVLLYINSCNLYVFWQVEHGGIIPFYIYLKV